MANHEIEWVAETKNKKFGRIVAPWDKEVEAFGKVGASLVLPEDVVEARLAGYDGFSRTRLIPVKVKGKNTILYKGNELVTPVGAREIVIAHVNGRYPARSTDFYDVVEDIARLQEGLEPEDRVAIVVVEDGDHSWTKEMPEARFTLGPRTKTYFERKVEPFGKTEIPYFDLVADSTEHATFNYVWFFNPLNDSKLDCGIQDLHDDSNALGVLEKTAEGGSRSPVYVNLTSVKKANSEAVARVLEEEGLSGLSKRLTSKIGEATLEQIRSYSK
ncbi:MAG: hypothetical protein AABX73_04595 [Nanoarchaeota archaeon]